MARTVTYTGQLGPAAITCGGIAFAKGVPKTIEDDALAGQLLAKGCFVEEKPKPAGRAAKMED